MLTKDQIQSIVDGLPEQNRVMIRLLLLQYLDLTQEDIYYMAADRPDPRFQQGQRPVRLTLSRDAVKSVADRAEQYRAQVRQRRERIWLQIQCLNKQIAYSEAVCKIAEDVLAKQHAVTSEVLQDLKRSARTAVPRPAIRSLDRRWDKEEISEEDYRRERLPIEHQGELRRLERYRTRLNNARREFATIGFVPLQDHEIAHIWGIPLSSLHARKVKALHQYLQSVQAAAAAGQSSPAPVSSAPVDLWKETFEALSKNPVERSVAVYDGMEGSEAALLDKLTAFATGTLQDEMDSRLWQAISRDYSPNAIEGQGVRQSLFALQRLLAILSEFDLSPEALEEHLLAKVSPRAKTAPDQGDEAQAQLPQLGEMAEHVLRSMRGEDRS
jgi:hypothetical protein